jgi:hypothetical protein
MKFQLGTLQPRPISFMVGAITAFCALTISFSASAQNNRQTQTDTFTRYELLAPSTQSFRIYYDVSATRAGAQYYYNPIRRGSDPDVHGVYDRMSGKALKWELVDGDDPRESGLVPNAEDQDQYIKVYLARPVPKEGRGRMLIDKTYMDAKSYYAEGETIIFSRTLGIKRNAVVLPHGYELVSVNYPSQVIQKQDGRIEVSFINPGSIGVPYTVKARPLKGMAKALNVKYPDMPKTTPQAQPLARTNYSTPQRTSQTRDIVYFLQAPDTHDFRLYHDYTEEREGVNKYLNVVRTGSKAKNPSAFILDTGEKLKVETLRGDEITKRGIDIGESVTDSTELVVIWFDAVKKGASTRLRIEETYTDKNRYYPVEDGFVWDRSFGRSANTVILPHGYYLTDNAVPATVKLYKDGRVELRYINDDPGNINVFIKGTLRK